MPAAAWFCQFVAAILLHLMTFSLCLIALSFCYRYYILSQ